LDRGNDEFFQLSKKISDECNKKQILKQNTPVSVAAASIFTAVNILKLPISRGDVSKIANTSEVTISKCVKELQPYKKDFVVYVKQRS
jgi:transcription initiation factor TFIIIB Brf1 subunit/transcription initiation factor TFIIB